MGNKYHQWKPLHSKVPNTIDELKQIILVNRNFTPKSDLDYGDYGLSDAAATIAKHIRANHKIALYADYDVDGTMSCVSWIWFLKSIGYTNFVHYIPCRFKEGYGVNQQAIEHLVQQENVQLIITMDTGITANEEASYCRSQGVDFICTDHHKIQPEKMPDCLLVNPKTHSDPDYQELCGCGITFVLLRKLSRDFPVPAALWTDLLALAGMATICDMVPLNPVNHRLAKLGVNAIHQSTRPIFQALRKSAQIDLGFTESDIGFKLGPRINAVGRLGHADKVIKAFIDEDPTPLVTEMTKTNEQRKKIQDTIIKEAQALSASQVDSPILFLGGDWHPGVVGIAASRMVENHWKPSWLFERGKDLCKGSARSIAGFDITDAMQSASGLFKKFGGHKAAGGFSFDPKNETEIHKILENYALEKKRENPDLWNSTTDYDCEIPLSLLHFDLLKALEDFRPYGMNFDEPLFLLKGTVDQVQYYNDKQTGKPKHTALFIEGKKIVFFQEVISQDHTNNPIQVLVSISKNTYQGRESLSLMGTDWF